jgi:hypothetical protein
MKQGICMAVIEFKRVAMLKVKCMAKAQAKCTVVTM